MNKYYGSISLKYWSSDTIIGLIQVPSLLLDEAINNRITDDGHQQKLTVEVNVVVRLVSVAVATAGERRLIDSARDERKVTC
jgi:hypothetical protein